MLVRLRSSTLGILGLVAAVGLGLVAIVYQQGWPEGLTGPLPQAPGPDFLRNDSIAAPAATVGRPIVLRESPSRGRKATGSAGSDSVAASELTAAQPVSASPQPVPAPDQPAPAPQPAGQNAAPATTVSTPAPSTGQTPEGSRPGPSEGASPPVAAGGGGQSPGQSGDEHGNHGSGPPSWASNDDDSPGNGSWGDDDYGDDGSDYGDDDHGGGWGRH